MLQSKASKQSRHNNELKSLSIRTITSTNAVFQQLEELILTEIGNVDHLIAFVKANSTIKELRIIKLQEARLSNSSFVILINEIGLKVLEIRNADTEIEGIFNQIQIGFGTLKTLTIRGKKNILPLRVSQKRS